MRAKLGDVLVDGALAAREVLAPDTVEQFPSGVDAARVAREEGEELELAPGEVERASLDLGASGVHVHAQSAHPQGARAAGGAAQQGVDARDELGGAEGLGEVVVAAAVEALHAVHLARAGGEHQDGQVGVALVLAQAAQPVHAGQVREGPVEDDGVRAGQGVPARAGVGRGADAQARPGEVEGDGLAHGGLVLDDDDDGWGHGRSRGQRPTARPIIPIRAASSDTPMTFGAEREPSGPIT